MINFKNVIKNILEHFENLEGNHIKIIDVKLARNYYGSLLMHKEEAELMYDIRVENMKIKKDRINLVLLIKYKIKQKKEEKS